MANIKSAKKRIRVIEKKTQRNKRVKSRLKEILKDLESAVAARDKETAREKLALAEKKLMQAASKGTVHRNTASRKISRITATFRSAFGQEALLEKANKPSPPVKSKTEKPAKAAAPAIEESGADKEAGEGAEDRAVSKTRSTKKESAEEAVAQTPDTEDTPGNDGAEVSDASGEAETSVTDTADAQEAEKDDETKA
jgi:small subunit ribosomal protein S20